MKSINIENYLLSGLMSLIFVCLIGGWTHQCKANIRYVKEVATGLGDGSSWANASDSLQVMIDASSGGQVWVAAGIYKPTNGADRTISFQMNFDVAIYGGFPNTGNPTFEDRDWVVHSTILSGDLLGDDGMNFTNISDNSYHVIANYLNTIGALGDFAGFDGFIISGGNADGINPHDAGGGVYSLKAQWRLKNCTLTDNSAAKGGAMAFFSAPVTIVSHCTFIGNHSTSDGGAIYIDNSIGSLTSSFFIGNEAVNNGGGIYNVNFSFPQPVTNSVFLGNKANNGGGIFDASGSILNVTNCSFAGNEALTDGGAYYNDASSFNSTLANCILWGNSAEIFGSVTVHHSIVQQGGGVYPGTGNLNLDPLFVLQPSIGLGTSGDLRLQSGSPAIDSASANSALYIDLDRKRRAIGQGFDMGAFEAGSPCPPAIVYVDSSATGMNNGTSWVDAFTDLQAALIPANICQNEIQVWVATGTYKPTSGVDRFAHFSLRNRCAIYGGFSGNETDVNQRDWITNPCILSGDLLNDDGPNFINYSDNSYHVIFNGDGKLNHSAILDGFTISGGYSNSNSIYLSSGAGMYNFNASPLVINCTFTKNSSGLVSSPVLGGAGIFNYSYSAPTISNCELSGNHALNSGGGIYAANNSSVTLIETTISNNTTNRSGGGLVLSGGSANISNCSFSNNSASTNGGGIVTTSATLSVKNSQFSGNQAGTTGGAIYNLASEHKLSNSIFIGCDAGTFGGGIYNNYTANSSITNCSFSGNTNFAIYNDQTFTDTVSNTILWGNAGGIANVMGCCHVLISTNDELVDPLFVNQPPLALGTTGNLRLQLGSPDIDTASPTVAPNHDADGKMRPIGGGFDKGAYEYGIDCTAIIVTFNGNGDGVSWTDAGNWSLGVVPTCQNIFIPSGHDVVVPSNFDASGLTLDVESGSSLTTESMSTMSIGD